MNCLVSVIIPTYNRCEYLIKTISSVQRQTIRDIEILVCDDGSTDRTKEMVEGLAEKDNRIRYINCGHNGRPAIPRNIGIKNAEGEWLAFVDDDDVWNPVKLEAQLFTLKKNDVKACCTNAFCFYDGENSGKRYFKVDAGKIRLRDLLNINRVICSSMVIHKSLISICEGFPEDEEIRAIEDYALWLRVSTMTDIAYLSNPLIGYLMESESSIRLKKQLPFAEQQKIVLNDFYKWLDKQDSRVKKKVSKEKVQSKLTGVVKAIKDIKKLFVKAFRKFKSIVKKLIKR